jgi:glutathione synthase/RimK-type ligase-like ATP-grasp enzyme
MKIGIHHSKAKGSFSKHWIDYCEEKQISWKQVNCYDTDIINQLVDCDALMWHFHQANPKDLKFAKQLLYSVQASGKKVFPDFNTCWHFDDKVGQKYLLEAIGAPLVPSYVFYSKAEALQWTKLTTFPKVFKLRGGAGSANVRLIRTNKQAKKIINKAFGSGFRRYDPWGGLKERFRMFRLGKSDIADLIEGLGRFILRTDFEKIAGKDKGYVYFQDFIDGCSFDIRVKIADDKCWVYKRLIRENDFRASGSDLQVFSPEGVPMEVIETAFNLSRKLQLQCVAFDFLLSKEYKPLLLEISYGFGYKDDQHYAYWDSEMNWHNEKFNPFGWMVENLIRDIKD